MAPKPGRLFYPKYLDISAEESAALLKQLEFEAYAGIISALRSQGDLTKEKKNLLTEVCACLGISGDRHCAEIRRAVNDEKLATVALHNSGFHSDTEWLKEGRRMAQLPHRPLQITAYMEEADRVAYIITKENATLPEPSDVDWGKFIRKSSEVAEPPEKPAEMKIKTCVRMHSLYCVKCLSEQSERADASTSTDELYSTKKIQGSESILQPVPSASDSCVFLPSGTTVHISAGKSEKEEQDAYSLKPNIAGNFDFGNAPEINLTGSRSNKRKRKKSSGLTAQMKEERVTIRQVIRPSLMSGGQRKQESASVTFEEYVEGNHSKEIAVRRFANAELKQRLSEDSQASSSQVCKSKRKRQVSQAVTVQHTPVPPEHLYAVGATKPKRRTTAVLDAERLDRPQSPHAKSENSTANLEKSSIGQQGVYNNPLSPSYYSGRGSAAWSAVPPLSSEGSVLPSSSRGFHYSPMKSFYRPPNIVQTMYGRSSKAGYSKRHRALSSTFPLAKKIHRTESEHRNTLKKISSKKIRSGVKKIDGEYQQDKAYRSPGLCLPFSESTNTTFMLPMTEENLEDRPPITLSHSSSLEELASVSLMATAISTSTRVETGLAPVSAIVSRVTSPAPGQISTDSGNERPFATTQSMSGPRAQCEEETHSADLAKAAQGSFSGHEWLTRTSRHVSAFGGVNSGAAKLNALGNLSDSRPPAQVRLAVTSTDNTTITNVPISFTSILPPAISSLAPSQIPMVISTLAARSHTLLKSSSRNVITVTANPLPGMKSSVSTIVSGSSIVKPQIGQKTSIIVVHKTPGAKVGKAVSANFPTLGVDGVPVLPDCGVICGHLHKTKRKQFE